MRVATLLLLSAFALSGCYQYSAVPAESVPEGVRVRARISAAESERLAEVLGRETRVLEGRVVEGTPEGLLLQVPSTVRTAGTAVQWLSQRVEVPRAGLLELEARRLDPWRTAGAVAAVVTVVGYAVVEAFDAVGNPSGEGTKGGSDRYIGVSFQIRR